MQWIMSLSVPGVEQVLSVLPLLLEAINLPLSTIKDVREVANSDFSMSKGLSVSRIVKNKVSY